MSSVLVTGVAGFIGSHLTERLLDAGHDVVGVDGFTDSYDSDIKRANVEAALSHRRFRLLELDLGSDDLSSLPRAELVFHLAARAGVRTSWGGEFGDYVYHNVLATQRLLERCLDVPPERFVYASSSSVYGDAERFPTAEDDLPKPFSPYGVTKLAGEHLCLLYQRNFGVPCVALRFFTVYGPRQRPDMGFHRFCEAVLDGGAIEVYGDGTQRRDFTFVEDAVAATIAASERGRPGAVYNVGGGSPIELRQVLEMLRRFAGGTLRIERVEGVPGDAPHTGADLSRARAELGYEARVSLEEGLAAQLAWHRSRRAARRETA